MKTYLSWLLPYTCILCHQPSQRRQDLCVDCLNNLPILSHPCPSCALPLPGDLQTPCGSCQRQTPAFNKIHALFTYQTPITQLILQLKFHHQLIYARIFGELLAEKIQCTWYRTTPLPNVIIPVPLHPSRLQKRGFNQALEIAKPLAKILRLPIDTQCCSRIKPTPQQITLSAEKRRHNLQYAFQIHGDLSGMIVAIVDDVVTTGSTVQALSATLKKHGANAIHVWCCARTAVTLPQKIAL